MIGRIIAALILAFAGAGLVFAQSSDAGGQFCLRAFEDRNANGQLDADEPLITRGLSVNLLDASGLTIASALLDNSPTSAAGVVCFQFLPAGQYTMVVTSADYEPTTPASISGTVAAGGVPTIVEFGGRLAAADAAPTPSSASSIQPPDRETIIRVVLALLGALVVITGMSFMGVILYLLAFRRKPADVRRTTGSMRVVRPPTTGSVPVVSPTDTGEFPET